MSYNPYENNPYQHHTAPPPPPTEVVVEKEKNKGAITTAIITGIFVIIGAIITGIFGLIHLNSSGPTPASTSAPSTVVVAQFPRLHATYTGSYEENGGQFTLNMTNLTENADGTFQATQGNVGYCYATFSGNVKQDGTITINVQQLAGGPYNCSPGNFVLNGTVSGDGANPNGTWQGGTWSLK